MTGRRQAFGYWDLNPEALGSQQLRACAAVELVIPCKLIVVVAYIRLHWLNPKTTHD